MRWSKYKLYPISHVFEFIEHHRTVVIQIWKYFIKKFSYLNALIISNENIFFYIQLLCKPLMNGFHGERLVFSFFFQQSWFAITKVLVLILKNHTSLILKFFIILKYSRCSGKVLAKNANVSYSYLWLIILHHVTFK